jgi:hypothetical protein
MTSQPDQAHINIWQLKPWWCQPWSILLTGITLIGGSWLLFTAVWITVLVAIPIGSWMGFFLLVYPQLMQQDSLQVAAENSTPETTNQS